MNTTLTSITRDFHTTLASTEWVVLGYLLSLAVCIPCSGWLGDRFGTRRVYLCGPVPVHRRFGPVRHRALPRRAHLLPYRAGHRRRLPRARRPGDALPNVSGGPAGTRRRAWWPSVPVSVRRRGPVLGGVLVTELSWRWCFYVNLPFGILALIDRAAVPARAPGAVPGRLRRCRASCSPVCGLAMFLYCHQRVAHPRVGEPDDHRRPGAAGVGGHRRARSSSSCTSRSPC